MQHLRKKTPHPRLNALAVYQEKWTSMAKFNTVLDVKFYEVGSA